MASNVNLKNIKINYPQNVGSSVNLRWYRGANRYNNGATRYKSLAMCRIIRLRLIMSRAKDASKDKQGS